MNLLRLVCILLLMISTEAFSETPENIPIIDPFDLRDFSESRTREVFFKNKPFIGTYWKIMPIVRICPGSGVNLSRAESATRYWKRLGYDVGPITIDKEHSSACFLGGYSGEITIMLVTSEVQMNNNLAMTRNYYYKKSREIVKAQVYIFAHASKKPFVLEHEIGHALGWLHYNRRHHIMHGEYASCGYDSTGLEIRAYMRQVSEIKSEMIKQIE